MRKFLLLVLTVGQTALAFTGMGARPERQPEFIEIQGPVAPHQLGLIPRLVELAERDGEVEVLINTFGGYTMVSGAFVDTFKELKSKGIKVKCYVGFVAVSAGFHILEHCSERYALQYSKLMFHPVRVFMSPSEPMTAVELLKLAESLHEDDVRELTTLCEVIGKGDQSKCADIAKAYYAERLWESGELKDFDPAFLTILPYVKGAPEHFYKVPTSSLPGLGASTKKECN